MNEKDITKLCVAVSILGIIIIYLADVSMQPKKIDGAALSPELAGERVTICGSVYEPRTSKGGTVFFKIDDGAKTNVVVFENRATEDVIAKITNGAKLCITGIAEEYQGKMEIVASKVG